METLRTGSYRICNGSNSGPEEGVLTSTENGLTVAAKGAVPESDQEFRVECTENGHAIQFPATISPNASLSYKESQSGERLILGPPGDLPTRVWEIEERRGYAHGGYVTIRVPDTDLVLGISPKPIHPPQLELMKLGIGTPSVWRLEFLRK
ncbi:hypothetical protein [Streptomyces sp. NPDC005385]|uniref:hypothetical protein n=1 Tax=Streptomyces sp. NPDC005385 TaxID=3157039 RepID=UPI0033A2C25F